MAFLGKKAVDLNSYGFTSLINGGSTSMSGIVVNDSVALSDSTFFACVKVKAQTIGQLPVELFKVNKDGTETKVVDSTGANNKMLRALTLKPNKRQTIQEFIELGVAHMDTSGNYYARIFKNQRDEIISILPFNSADSVMVNELPNNDLSYTVMYPNGQSEVCSSDEILHIRGLAYNTYKGLDVTNAAADSIGLSVAATKHASNFYKNGSTPGGYLQAKKGLTEDAANRLIKQFENRHASVDNAHKTMVLEEGMEYKKLDISLKEAQLLETRRNSVEEICRILGVPPQMIGYNIGTTFTNVEEMNRFFYNSTLGALITKFENGINSHMPSGYKIRFDVSKFTKADTKTTIELVDKMFKSSMLTIDEGRAKLGLSPLPENGDLMAIGTNNTVIGKISDVGKNNTEKPEQVSTLPTDTPDDNTTGENNA